MKSDKIWHMVFAIGPDGSDAHISTVVSGLACRCRCRECGEPVVAHKGRHNAHHFQHLSRSNCKPSAESDLHKFAKTILAERLCLWLPTKQTASFTSEALRRTAFVSVALEKTDENIRPDLILTKKDGRQLRVEIYVRHRCDDDKIRKCIERDISIIEIDLSKISWEEDPQSWIEQILETAPRHWLHNSKFAADERSQAAAADAQKVALIAAWNAAKNLSLKSDDRLIADRAAVHDAGLAGTIGFEVPGASCFTVPPELWQARLIRELMLVPDIRSRPKFSSGAALEVIRDFIGPGLDGFIDKPVANLVRVELREFRTPWEAMFAYLKHLQAFHFLNKQRSGQQWVTSETAVSAFENRQREKKLEADWAIESGDWLELILDKLPSEDLHEFDREAWLAPHRLSYDDADLQQKMRRIWSMLYEEAEPVRDLLDLPLKGEVERRRAAHSAKVAAEQTAMRVAMQKREADDRVQLLVGFAEIKLGGKSEDWLVTPIPDLGPLSPIELARSAESGLQSAKRNLLDMLKLKAAAIRREAECAANKLVLTKRVAERFKDAQKASLWLNSGQLKLGGRRPIDSCGDPMGLKTCLGLLPR